MAASATSVSELYRTLLSREADTQGLNRWMQTGKSLDSIRKGIMGSKEYKSRSVAPASGVLPSTPSVAPAPIAPTSLTGGKTLASPPPVEGMWAGTAPVKPPPKPARPPVQAPWLQQSAQISAPSIGASTAPSIGAVTAPPAPTFSVSPVAQGMIDRYVGNTQQQGSQELQRQLQEDFLPSLKSAAAASGQVNADGTVNGSFLENFTRQQGQVGRELANIVLGAQTQGIDKGLEQGRFEMGESGKAADRTLTASVETAKNQLASAQIASNEKLAQAKIALEAQVANGQLSLGQANLRYETARAESANAIEQQKLRLGLLSMLGGQQMDMARLGIGAITDAQGRQRSDISMLNNLGGQDFQALIDALQAMKLGGGTTKQSGSLLGDMLGIGGLGVAGYAAGI